jgi:mitotic spindle assembly checkpoint protein MAD2
VFNEDSKSRQKASAQGQENAAPDSEADAATPEVEKSETEIQQEIQALFRQITASVSFLPMLDGNCTFNVLVYADADSDVPLEWGDSDAKEVKNAEKVQLRSFSTNSHRIDTLVSYRYVAAAIMLHASTNTNLHLYRLGE